MEDGGLSFTAVSTALGLEPCPQPLGRQARPRRVPPQAPTVAGRQSPGQSDCHQARPSTQAKVPTQFVVQGKLSKGLMLMEGVALSTSGGAADRGAGL